MGSPAHSEQSLGKRGSIVIDDTAEHTGRWIALVAGPAGCTIDSITCENKENAAGITGKALPAGYVTYGNITAVTLTSGTCENYNA